jgi:hypothetical protein
MTVRSPGDGEAGGRVIRGSQSLLLRQPWPRASNLANRYDLRLEI